jgi:hypothetical protein
VPNLYRRMRSILHNATNAVTHRHRKPVAAAPASHPRRSDLVSLGHPTTVTGRAHPLPGTLIRARDVYSEVTVSLPRSGEVGANMRPYASRRAGPDRNRNEVPRTFGRQRVAS